MGPQKQQSGSRYAVLQTDSGETQIEGMKGNEQGQNLRKEVTQEGQGWGVQVKQSKHEKNVDMGSLYKENEKNKPRNKVWGTQESKRAEESKGSNVAAYGWQEVHMADKEILHPRDYMDTTWKTVVMDASLLQLDGKKVVASSDVSMSAEERSSKGVAAVIRDFKYRYKLDLIVILEPRISGSHASMGEEIFFTAVYTSPSESKRHRLWETLYNLACDISKPWLLTWDFNDTKTPLEQKGGGRVNEIRYRKFNDWIEDCSLIDVETQ
ncbi:hypothetical protein K1719_025285 [Acacia pycnantha]|nr:hypothetical protein K1719_025285 [Acacia pycnantha]